MLIASTLPDSVFRTPSNRSKTDWAHLKEADFWLSGRADIASLRTLLASERQEFVAVVGEDTVEIPVDEGSITLAKRLDAFEATCYLVNAIGVATLPPPT